MFHYIHLIWETIRSQIVNKRSSSKRCSDRRGGNFRMNLCNISWSFTGFGTSLRGINELCAWKDFTAWCLWALICKGSHAKNHSPSRKSPSLGWFAALGDSNSAYWLQRFTLPCILNLFSSLLFHHFFIQEILAPQYERITHYSTSSNGKRRGTLSFSPSCPHLSFHD
jgi:hypothetical protein